MGTVGGVRALSIPHERLALIGMMGTGKTTVGQMLATRLEWKFWDNDAALRAATGETAAEYQRLHGQPALHEIEDRLLGEALQTETHTVFAAAASVVLHPSVLARAFTVWLRADGAWEAQNIARSGQGHRPLPADAKDTLRQLSADREKMYASAADLIVDVAMGAATTCERVVEALVNRTP